MSNMIGRSVSDVNQYPDLEAARKAAKNAKGQPTEGTLKIGGRLCAISSQSVIKQREGQGVRNALRKLCGMKETRMTITPLITTQTNSGTRIIRSETPITFIYNKGVILDESGKRLEEIKKLHQETKATLETENKALDDEREELKQAGVTPKQINQTLKAGGKKLKKTNKRSIDSHLREDSKDMARRILDNVVRNRPRE
jgi:hypothetical protein